MKNYLLKKIKKLDDKQLTTDLINHHMKQQEFFGGKRKKHPKIQSTYSESSSGDTESKHFITKKRKTKRKITKKYKR